MRAGMKIVFDSHMLKEVNDKHRGGDAFGVEGVSLSKLHITSVEREERFDGIIAENFLNLIERNKQFKAVIAFGLSWHEITSVRSYVSSISEYYGM